MTSIAIIPARGGSKRIPRKNIKDFLGEPIISYSIRAALASKVFDTIMVSTDDEEIAQIARQYGAKVPFLRTPETASDFATTEDVINEVLQEYLKRGEVYDSVCCIYPTAPFITSEKLKAAMELLLGNGIDSVFPVVKFSYPPQRSFIIESGNLVMKYPEYLKTRSQDLEEWYHDCGQFYCVKTKAFIENCEILTSNTVPIVMSEIEVQDIDTEEDWKLAEVKYLATKL